MSLVRVHNVKITHDTEANILAIGAANNAVHRQWYYDDDNEVWYWGKADGSLMGPIPGVGYITSKDDTATVALDVTGGELTANVKISATAGNHISAEADGIYAKALSIHTDSTAYAEIDSNYQLKFKQLLITDNTVDSTNSTLSAHLTAVGYNSGNLIYQESDIIILTLSHQTWIQNGGSAGTTADFTAISADVTDSYIRNLFSGTSGVSYNSGTGVFSLATNGVQNSNIRQSLARSVIGRSANSDGNVADIQSSANGHFLVQRSNALTFGLLEAGDIPAVSASKWTTTGSDIYRNSNVRIGSSTAPDGKLAITMPGSTVTNRAISITRDGGWSNSYIDSYASASPNQRGLIIGGTNNVGSDQNLIWINTFTKSIGFKKVPEATYDFEIDDTSTGTFRFSRTGSTENALINMNTAGDLIFRNSSGHYSFGSVSQSVSTINPSANIHLFAAGAASEEDVFILEKAGGYGSTRIKTYYTTNTNRGIKINHDSVSNLLTLRGSTSSGTCFVGIKNETPEYDLDVAGNSRSSGGLWVGGGTVTIASGIITAQNGFRINNAATSGQYLRGNGTNFVSSALLASDLSGTVPVANGGTGLTALGTALQYLRTNAAGTAMEWATLTPATYTFNNGLTESGGTVKFGGSLLEARTLALGNFNLFFTRGTGKVTFFDTTAGPSGFNIYNNDLELQPANPASALTGIIWYSPNGTRWRVTMSNEGALTSTSL